MNTVGVRSDEFLRTASEGNVVVVTMTPDEAVDLAELLEVAIVPGEAPFDVADLAHDLREARTRAISQKRNRIV